MPEFLKLSVGLPGPKDPKSPLNLFIVPGKVQPKDGFRQYVCFRDILPPQNKVEAWPFVEMIQVSTRARDEHMGRAEAIQAIEDLFQWQISKCTETRLKAFHCLVPPQELNYIIRALRKPINRNNSNSMVCHEGIEALFHDKKLDLETYFPKRSILVKPFDPFDL